MLLVSLAVCTVWYRSAIVFGWLWFTLFIVQWCNLVTLHQPIAERYLYLPNVGLMYALSSLILSLPQPYPYILLTAYITFYAVRLFYHLPAYKDDVTFFHSNTDNFPTLYNTYNSYGAAMALRGQFGAAIDTWINGLQYRPEDFKLNSNIGSILMKLGNFPVALDYLNKSLKHALPDTSEVQLVEEVKKKVEFCEKRMKELGLVMAPTGPNSMLGIVGQTTQGGGTNVILGSSNTGTN